MDWMSATSKPEEGITGELTHDAQPRSWLAPISRPLGWFAERIGAFLGPNTALVLTLVIGMAVVVALSELTEEVYEAVVEADGVAVLDRPLLDFAKDLRSPALTSVVTFYTDLAGTTVMPVIAVVGLLILSIRRRSWTPAILIAAAGIGSLLMTVVGKRLIGRTRPSLSEAVPPFESSPSFPSGHTLNAVVVIGVIVYLLILRRRSTRAKVLLIVGAVLFAVTIGLSRVFLGHHWFTDVAAGWMLGAAWLALVITAHRLYLAVRLRQGSPSSGGARPDPA
ncbi:phosphatase PAP2 family protein [soil metagenome]